MIALAAALTWVERNFPRLGVETVPLALASGRVLAAARPPASPMPPVAALDGYAVRAAATEGASDYAPLPVRAVPIVSGAPLPPDADAVLPVHWFEAGAALSAVAVGEGVAAPDALAVPAGPLQPAALAALVRRDEATVEVVRRPSVRLVVAAPKTGGDALTPMLKALLDPIAIVDGRAPDLVLHAGRSGAGSDDDGALAFDTVFAHGVHIDPGETTTLGLIGATPALLLPGDPLACFIAFTLLAAPALRRMGGVPEPAALTATLGRKIVSSLGRVDAVRVRLEHGVATPTGPSSLAAKAHGLLLVPEGSEGYPAGAAVAISPLP